jgi:hypothetical protein
MEQETLDHQISNADTKKPESQGWPEFMIAFSRKLDSPNLPPST